jgi:hypothetical protein
MPFHPRFGVLIRAVAPSRESRPTPDWTPRRDGLPRRFRSSTRRAPEFPRAPPPAVPGSAPPRHRPPPRIGPPRAVPARGPSRQSDGPLPGHTERFSHLSPARQRPPALCSQPTTTATTAKAGRRCPDTHLTGRIRRPDEARNAHPTGPHRITRRPDREEGAGGHSIGLGGGYAARCETPTSHIARGVGAGPTSSYWTSATPVRWITPPRPPSYYPAPLPAGTAQRSPRRADPFPPNTLSPPSGPASHS